MGPPTRIVRSKGGRSVTGSVLQPWLVWALLSALFAALTAIFAKVGVEGINSDLATLLRTIIIVAVLSMMLLYTGKLEPLTKITARTWAFLTLSGLATGASWLCYFRALKVGEAARVAPIDKLSVVLVAVIGVTILGEHLSPLGWTGIILIAAGAALVAIA
jgi:transporter family protein